MKTKQTPKVEFYEVSLRMNPTAADLRDGFSWRLRAVNNKIIASPHESFTRHRDAVRSFATCANALDAKAVFEVTGFAPEESHRLLVGMR